MAQIVHCDEHGEQEATFVCQHIVQTLADHEPRGFFWSGSSTQSRPDAWCSKCETLREQSGGEWTDAVMEHVKIRLLCGACYDLAKKLNLG